jgi:hypothetical protein
MKKIIFLMSFALILLIGCDKEEPNLITLSTSDRQVSESGTLVFVSDGEKEFWEVISADELQDNSGSVTTRSNSAHTHGEFTATGEDPAYFGTYTFNGTQNNGGSHGSAEIIQVRPDGNRHFIMETACVSVEGNEGIYGGMITEVIENTVPNPPPPPPPPPCPTFPDCPPPPPPCDIFSVGTYFVFKVIDNGQGNNAPTDQYFNLSIAGCALPGNCFADFPLWPFFGVGDVANESDKIKVNK